MSNVHDEPLSNYHAASGQDGVGKVQTLNVVESSKPLCRQEGHQMLDQEGKVGYGYDCDDVEGIVEALGGFFYIFVDFI